MFEWGACRRRGQEEAAVEDPAHNFRLDRDGEPTVLRGGAPGCFNLADGMHLGLQPLPCSGLFVAGASTDDVARELRSEWRSAA
jgi:hypothetical protein